MSNLECLGDAVQHARTNPVTSLSVLRRLERCDADRLCEIRLGHSDQDLALAKAHRNVLVNVEDQRIPGPGPWHVQVSPRWSPGTDMAALWLRKQKGPQGPHGRCRAP